MTARRGCRGPDARRSRRWLSVGGGLSVLVALLMVASLLPAPSSTQAPATGLAVAPSEVGASGSGTADASGPATVPVSATASAGAVPRQFSWAPLPPNGTTPPALAGAGLAADPALSEAVLFGGSLDGQLSNSTWIYAEASNQWEELPIGGPVPSPRSDFGFAADPATQTAVLFGGLVDSTSLAPDASTWLFYFSNDTWRNVTAVSAAQPPAREDTAFAVSPTFGEGLLYGGWDQNYSGRGALTFSDLWTLDLGSLQWTEAPTPAPPRPGPLEGASLAWVNSTGEFEMFGGCFPCSSTVWAYSASADTWTSVPTTGGAPEPSASSAWAYDPAQDTELLFGGLSGSATNSTWALNASDGWTAETTTAAPSPRFDAAATWLAVPTNASLLVLGGAASASLETAPAGASFWRLAADGNLTVRVLNASDAAPIANATLVLNGTLAGQSGPTGLWNVSSVDPSNLTLSAFSPGYAPLDVSFWASPGLNFTETVDLAPVPPANLTVEVITPGGQPIPGADVNVTIEGVLFRNPPLTTDSEGLVTYTGIPTAPVEVTAWERLFHPNSTLVDLVAGGTVDRTLILVPFAEADVLVVGSYPTGEPNVPLVNASVYGNGLLIGSTNDEGNLVVRTGFEGPNLISAEAPGFSPKSVAVDVPLTGTYAVNLTLPSLPYGYVDLRVLDAKTHLPVFAAEVNFTDVPTSATPGEAWDFLTVPGGFSNDTLPPSNYSAIVWRFGYYPNGSLGVVPVRSYGVHDYTVNLTPTPPQNGTGPGLNPYSLFPPGVPAVWPFLVVPALLLLAGVGYLALTRSDRLPAPRPTPVSAPSELRPPPSPPPRPPDR